MRSLIALLILFPGLEAASEPTVPGCISNVEPIGDASVAYRKRGSRCEGRYGEPVSHSIRLRLVGYHFNPLPADAPQRPLQLHVPGVENPNATTLRAISTKPRVHYLMDTEGLSSRGDFAWPTDLIRHPSVNLMPRDFAVIACSNSCQSSKDTVFWPVALDQDPTMSASQLVLVLQANVELEEIYLTALDAQGKTIRNALPFGKGYYPAGRPVYWPLKDYPAGPVKLVVVAESKGKASADTQTLTIVVPRS